MAGRYGYIYSMEFNQDSFTLSAYPIFAQLPAIYETKFGPGLQLLLAKMKATN